MGLKDSNQHGQFFKAREGTGNRTMILRSLEAFCVLIVVHTSCLAYRIGLTILNSPHVVDRTLTSCAEAALQALSDPLDGERTKQETAASVLPVVPQSALIRFGIS